MRKSITIIVLAVITCLTACSKKATTHPTDGGTWTFKSVTYTGNAVTGHDMSLTAADAFNTNNVNYGTLYCSFSSSLPVSAGMYQVVRNGGHLGQHQIMILLTSDGSSQNTYNSTGGQGRDSVLISVADGLVSAKGSSIQLSNGSDSSYLDLDIHQLN